MLKHLFTKSGSQFVYDDQTVTRTNGIIKARFVMLRAEKIIRIATKKKTGEQYAATNYDYSSQLFNNLQMCEESDIESDKPADDTLTDLYNRISHNQILGADLQKLLRESYLKVIDMRDEQEAEKSPL